MKFQANIEDYTIDFQIHISDENIVLNIDKVEEHINLVRLTPYSYSLIQNGKSYYLTITEHLDGYNITIDQNVFFVKIKDENALLLEKFGIANITSESSGEIRAPIPGLVSSVYVIPGQKIGKGEKLMIIEAMKMENEINSLSDGYIREILVSSGDSVEKNSLLIKLEFNK